MLKHIQRHIINYILGRIDETRRSLHYILQDKRVIFWGGLIFLLSYILVGMPLVFGYISKCMRELLNGNKALPPIGKKRELYKEGLKVGIIGIEYLLLTTILFTLLAPLLYLKAADDVIMSAESMISFTGKHFIFSALLQAFIFGMLFNNAWLRYLITGRMLTAMNPIATIRWIATYPKLVFGNLFSTGILGMILVVPGILLITAPWVSFIGMVSNAYIRGDSYDRLSKSGDLGRHEILDFLREQISALPSRIHRS